MAYYALRLRSTDWKSSLTSPFPHFRVKFLTQEVKIILTLHPLRKTIPEVTLKSLSTHPRRVNVDDFTDSIFEIMTSQTGINFDCQNWILQVDITSSDFWIAISNIGIIMAWKSNISHLKQSELRSELHLIYNFLDFRIRKTVQVRRKASWLFQFR